MQLFKATRTAGAALVGDFKLRPYYSASFHLAAVASFVSHCMRALLDVAKLALRLLITVPIIVTPFLWLNIPTHLLETFDNFLGASISVITAGLSPVFFVLRTLSSVLCGYGEGSSLFLDEHEAESADLRATFAIC
jgi:hypothetical protein